MIDPETVEVAAMSIVNALDKIADLNRALEIAAGQIASNRDSCETCPLATAGSSGVDGIDCAKMGCQDALIALWEKKAKGGMNVMDSLAPQIVSKKDKPVFDLMWHFLMKGGQKGDFSELSARVHDLIRMTMQKDAGQRGKGIDWNELAPTLWSIVIEATAYVLDEEGKQNDE